jgi:hypothetical protein
MSAKDCSAVAGAKIEFWLAGPDGRYDYEPYMKSALGYVELVEKAAGTIPKPVDFTYIKKHKLRRFLTLATDRCIYREPAFLADDANQDQAL